MKRYWISVWLCGLVISSSAFAEQDRYAWGTPLVRANRGSLVFSVFPRGSLLNATTDAVGTRFLPASFSSGYRGAAQIEAIIGIADWFSVFFEIRSAIQGLNGRWNYGFNDQTAGMHFRLFQINGASLGIQIQGDIPVFYSATNADSLGIPYLGDGTYDFTAQIFWTQNWAQFSSLGGLAELISKVGTGGVFRTHGFSAEIPWSVGLELQPKTRGLFAGIGASGAVSLRTDTQTLGSALRPTTGSGGTGWSMAVNPTWVTLGAGLGYRFNSYWKLSAEFRQGVWGMGAPLLTSMGLGLELRLGADAPSEENKLNGFATYDLQGHVLYRQESGDQLIINRGSQDGVAIGQVFDIFRNQKALLRAKVEKVQAHEATLIVEARFDDRNVEPKDEARRLLWKPN